MNNTKLNYGYDLAFTINHVCGEIIDGYFASIAEKFQELGITEIELTDLSKMNIISFLYDVNDKLDYADADKSEWKCKLHLDMSKYDRINMLSCFSVSLDDFTVNVSDYGIELARHLLWDTEDVLNRLYAQKPKTVQEKFKDILAQRMHVEDKIIIITDPCYILPKVEFDDDEYENPPMSSAYIPEELADKLDFDKTSTDEDILEYYKLKGNHSKDYLRWYMKNVVERPVHTRDDEYKKLNLTRYLQSSTLYGDWECSVYDTDTNDLMGTFGADSGTVGVFLLDEVLAVNPDLVHNLNSYGAGTIIEHFTGDVYFEIVEHDVKSKYDDDRYTLHVCGTGNFNFRSTQTGF